MEKLLSAIQVAFAAFIILFGFGTMLRCMVNGSELFYIIMFALIGLVGRMMLRQTLKEYKELKHGDNKQYKNN